MVRAVNYDEAAAYIEELPKFTKKHTLDHTREFLRRLGNPGEDRKIIHVAGTNGKGSVCAYMQAILMAEGKRTGFFTSPHLISINERIRVDNIPVDDETFLDVFCQVMEVVEEMGRDGISHPSYFEFLYGMGMKAFAAADVEYIILETGLGGRLDATNSAEHPCLTVITSISLDHMDILGDTIEKIAAEKAGIIRAGVPLIFDGNCRPAAEVIRKTAQEKDAPCREISKNAYEILEVGRKSIAFCRVNAYDKDVTWQMPVCGVYQVRNAVLALEAADYLLADKHVHEDRWHEALAAVKWQGRMEEAAPHVTIDGAHNLGAVEAFTETVRILEEGKAARPVIIFSTVADKSYEQMISYLCGNLEASAYIVTEIDDRRKLPARELGQVFERYTDKRVIVKNELRDALETARDIRGEAEIYCLGSLYLAGMVKKLLAGGDEHA